MAGNASGKEFFLASLVGEDLARILGKLFPARGVWRGFPRQNQPIPCQNDPIPRHGKKKVKIFPAGAGLARKKSSFSPPGVTWRGKISIFDPGNSRHSPSPLAMPRQMRPRRKKRRGLVSTARFPP